MFRWIGGRSFGAEEAVPRLGCPFQFSFQRIVLVCIGASDDRTLTYEFSRFRDNLVEIQFSQIYPDNPVNSVAK
ncbi:hypothetical protein MAE02_03010 [Microvirga aerophila]|uniref:Uncharacterized protein n=1 Tax=Microvirga aerophila TaxID=670291 RepID=A0A512BL06_9HYPH|nr:hypothetical protein MAE02_03010 [Microvirga aerophila]